MDSQSRQRVGANCQSAATRQDRSSQSRAREEFQYLGRQPRRGYYTHRAGEGIVFVPYGLSPVAK